MVELSEVISPPASGDTVQAIRRSHVKLMSFASGGADDSSLRKFIARVRLAGKSVVDPGDRLSLERVLNHWTGVLATRGVASVEDFKSAKLIDYEGPSPDDQVQAPSAKAVLDKDRAYIRISALARQWKATKSVGYLLKSDALREAEQYASDADIKELVDASRRLRARNGKIYIYATTALAIIFGAIAAFAYFQWDRAEEESVEKGRLLATKDLLLQDNQNATYALQENQKQLSNLYAALQLKAAQSEQNRVAEDARNGALFSKSIDAIVTLLSDPSSGIESLPKEIREAVVQAGADKLRTPTMNQTQWKPDFRVAVQDYRLPTFSDASGSNGYDESFTGINLPLPGVDFH